MGELTCDDCGEHIEVRPAEHYVFDGALGCGCEDKETVGFHFKHDRLNDGQPDGWGLTRDGERFVDYFSGETPVMRTHTGSSGHGYHLGVGDGWDNSARFQFKQVPHDAWRSDYDRSKWPREMDDEIIELLAEDGPMDWEEIADRLGYPRKAVVSCTQNQTDIYHIGGGKFDVHDFR